MELAGTKKVASKSGEQRARREGVAETRRRAILAAAGEAFLSKGYAATTTLEIARLARTSKRALYQHFADKRAILDEMVRERSEEMTAPIGMAPPETAAGFFAAIEAFGATFLARLLDPTTLALYRLAISEGGRADDLGRALQTNGRDRVADRLRQYIAEGVARGFLATPDPGALTDIYLDVLTGWMTIERLLGAGPPPDEAALGRRASRAARALKLLTGLQGETPLT